MSITMTPGDVQHKSTWQDSETFAQSTATASRRLNNDIVVSFLGMGTATAGPVHNQYNIVATTTEAGRVGDAKEGQEKMIMATATGRADVFIEYPSGRLPLQLIEQSNPGATGDVTMVSATGTWVFQAANDHVYLKFMNGTWNFMSGVGATQSAAT